MKHISKLITLSVLISVAAPINASWYNNNQLLAAAAAGAVSVVSAFCCLTGTTWFNLNSNENFLAQNDADYAQKLENEKNPAKAGTTWAQYVKTQERIIRGEKIQKTPEFKKAVTVRSKKNWRDLACFSGIVSALLLADHFVNRR